ncbi:MAG: alpha/beta hydrolase [Herpetosiphonaceae bacterium]|nr:alpha/beta hydrolase [Herpetosiphonaceae bacterium]
MLECRLIEVDGATLEVFVGGDQGPLICEAHPYGGYTGHLADWDRRPAVARLVQVNGRGAGGSSRARDAQDYSFDRFIDDLEVVRRTLGRDPWIFMSDSAGVYASVHYALRYPHALRGLITGFLGPKFRRIVDDPRSVVSAVHPSREQLLATVPRPKPVDGASDFSGWVPVDDSTWIWYERDHPVCVYPFALPEHQRAYLSEMLTRPVDEHLDRIIVPALIFAGRYDPLAPLPYLEELRSIPGSEFVVLECGHADMDEGYDFETYQATLQRFLMERFITE